MSNKQQILIVDDNHINRQFFSMSLKKENYGISTAENGFEAIKLAKINNFDLILMDIRMPEIDGYETSEKIRLLPNHNDTPILATSAENISKDKKHYFNDFLLKPISPKLLVKQVKKYCPEADSGKIVFNQEIAIQYAYNDSSIMHKLIAMFIEDLPIQMSLLEKHMQLGDNQACIDAIHKIRGSCKACGAQELDIQLENLSVCIKDGDGNKKRRLQEVNLAVNNYLSIGFIKHQ